MNELRRRHRRPRTSQAARTSRAAVVLLAVLAMLAAGAVTPAWAYWTSTGSGSAPAVTGTLASPTGVTVPAAAAPDVAVSWTPGTGSVTPDGYVVARDNGTTVNPACGSTPATLLQTTSCVDSAVPDGTFTYVVTAVYASWTAPSLPSGSVVVENAAAVAFVVHPTDTLVNAVVTPSVTVALRTADGGPFPSSGVAVTIAIGTNPSAGTLAGTVTVNTDADGVATFDNLSLDKAGPDYTLTATSPGLTTDTSAPFTVTVPPILAAAQSFSILAGTAVVNTGVTTVSGDVGVSPGTSITGFPTGAIGGDTHAGDPTAAAAQGALLTAYNDLSTRTPDHAEVVGDLAGRTYLPGIYHSTAALGLTGTVTLDANDDPNAVFIFQTGAAFNTAADSVVVLANGAQAANVYWVVGGAAGTGAGATLIGNVLAIGAITLGAGTTLIGRALSRDAVTVGASTIRFTDALPPTMGIDGGAAPTTKDTTPTITGISNAALSSPVSVRIGVQTLSTTVGSGGAWTVTATALAAGTYQVVARVRDAAGNGTAVTQLLTVEVNPDPVAISTAESFAVLARTSITSTGTTVVNGDVGVSPGLAVTGLPPESVNGDIHVNDAVAATAQDDLAAAITEVSARTPHTEITANLAGQTFHIGIHHQTAALALTGTVILDAEGDPDAVFIFTTDAAFNTAADSVVVLANNAQAANVYWVVAGAVGTGAGTAMVGTLLATGAITLGAGTLLTGRALSRDAVTLAGNTITTPAPMAMARQSADAVVDSEASVTTDVTAPTPSDEDAASTPAADAPAESGADTSSTAPETSAPAPLEPTGDSALSVSTEPPTTEPPPDPASTAAASDPGAVPPS